MPAAPWGVAWEARSAWPAVSDLNQGGKHDIIYDMTRMSVFHVHAYSLAIVYSLAIWLYIV